jgi:signal transduction histidine kinase
MTEETVRKILLIDEPGYAEFLRDSFGRCRFDNVELIHVNGMGDAERHLSAQSVDLVLFDPGLPGTDGFSAIPRLRGFVPRSPVVVLTDIDDAAVVDQALRAGAQDYHVKGQIQKRALLRSLIFAIERKRLDCLKDQYIATVSHELRAPLTSIAGSLGLLMGHWGDHLPDAAARLVSIAQTSSQRLVRLIGDILDIERIETAHDGLVLNSIDIGRALQLAIDGSQGLAERNRTRFRLDIGSLRGKLTADPDRLVQVVINLLSNAIKASPESAEVVVTAGMKGSFVRISVRDHGSGVPADFRPYIFRRFARAPATCSRPEGSGLGLSIVKTIVERMGGRVGFDDAPDSGSIFYIDLPALDECDGLAASGRAHHGQDRA